MPAVVVLGTQWGDEGKGKIVDLLSEDADIVARFGGGANAGHTIVHDGQSIVLNLIPCGVRRVGKKYALGNGMVIDPRWLLREIRGLKAMGLLANDADLHISGLAHVTMPYHREIERLREKGNSKVGSTGNGIGPTYEAKTARRGIRMFDLTKEIILREKVSRNLEYYEPLITQMGGPKPELDAIVSEYLGYGASLGRYVCDTSRLIHDALTAGRSVLLEGSQGTLLDIDHGSYPHVTSSSLLAGSACAGIGIGPRLISSVLGVVKAYLSRASPLGAFPTRLAAEDEVTLREAGAEFIPNFVRQPHRCGWLDVAALRLAARLNGLSGIALTKLDVLSCFDRIKICVGYEQNGERFDELPLDVGEAPLTPIYEEFPSWGNIGGARRFTELPASTQAYVHRIEECVGVPVTIVSVGADRSDTMVLNSPFSR